MGHTIDGTYDQDCCLEYGPTCGGSENHAPYLTENPVNIDIPSFL